MRLYLAGADGVYQYLDGLDNLAFLVSYYYLKSGGNRWNIVHYANKNKIPLMLDCGAWTAYTKKIEIPVQDYINFCLEFGHHFNTIVSLDVIGNHENTAKNYQMMRDAKIDCIPTFHFSSPYEALDRLIRQTDYVGLGGIATKGGNRVSKEWARYVFATYPNIKFHGFGVTTPALLKAHSWHSVDGTTWMTAAVRYGRIMVNLGNGRFKWIAIQNQEQLEKNWHSIKDDIEEGWSLENGRTKHYERVSLRYNAKSLIDLVKYCTENKINQLQEYLI